MGPLGSGRRGWGFGRAPRPCTLCQADVHHLLGPENAAPALIRPATSCGSARSMARTLQGPGAPASCDLDHKPPRPAMASPCAPTSAHPPTARCCAPGRPQPAAPRLARRQGSPAPRRSMATTATGGGGGGGGGAPVEKRPQQPPTSQQPAPQQERRVVQLQAVDITPENFAPFGQVSWGNFVARQARVLRRWSFPATHVPWPRHAA